VASEPLPDDLECLGGEAEAEMRRFDLDVADARRE